MQQAVAKILNDPKTDKLLLGQGLDVTASTQEEFTKRFNEEIDTWAKVVKSLGLDQK